MSICCIETLLCQMSAPQPSLLAPPTRTFRHGGFDAGSATARRRASAGDVRAAHRRNPEPRGAALSWPTCTAASTRAAARCCTARVERQARFDAGELPDFLPETRDDPRIGLARRADPGRAARPPRRDHRPGRSQDDHQRAELRREGVHGRFRGFDRADARTTCSTASSICATRSPARSTTPRPRASTTASSPIRRC